MDSYSISAVCQRFLIFLVIKSIQTISWSYSLIITFKGKSQPLLELNEKKRGLGLCLKGSLLKCLGYFSLRRLKNSPKPKKPHAIKKKKPFASKCCFIKVTRFKKDQDKIGHKVFEVVVFFFPHSLPRSV